MVLIEVGSLCRSKHVPVSAPGLIGDLRSQLQCVYHGHSNFFTQGFIRIRCLPQVSCTNSAKAFDMTVALAVGARFVFLPSCLYHAIVLQTQLPFTGPVCMGDASRFHSGSVDALDIVATFRERVQRDCIHEGELPPRVFTQVPRHQLILVPVLSVGDCNLLGSQALFVQQLVEVVVAQAIVSIVPSAVECARGCNPGARTCPKHVQRPPSKALAYAESASWGCSPGPLIEFSFVTRYGRSRTCMRRSGRNT